MGRPFLPGSPGHLLYNLALGAGLVVGAPVWIPWVLLSRKRRTNLPERLGLRGAPPPTSADGRPTVWVHAVSVGETLAAVPLLRLLRRRISDVRQIITSVTLTGRETAVKSLSGVTDEGFYFPFDLPGLCGRFLDRLRPDGVVIVETEIWPNFIAACARRGGPAGERHRGGESQVRRFPSRNRRVAAFRVAPPGEGCGGLMGRRRVHARRGGGGPSEGVPRRTRGEPVPAATPCAAPPGAVRRGRGAGPPGRRFHGAPYIDPRGGAASSRDR